MAGPNLGTLLIQRLDAALGISLSQQSKIVNRAGPDAVTQPGQSERSERVDNTLLRHPRESVDQALTGRARRDTQVTSHTGPEAARANQAQAKPFNSTSVKTTLGPAARIILQLFAEQGEAAPALRGRDPLLPAAPSAQRAADAPQATPQSSGALPAGQAAPMPAQALAHALAHALQHSGLFYESHLKLLAVGHYRATDLKQEPQAMPSRAYAHDDGAGTSDPTRPAASSGNATPGIDPATHTVVRQQLQTLADQAIHWRGDAWPGAPMELRLIRYPSEDRSKAASPADADARYWESRLNIHLPGLGPVGARLTLNRDMLHLVLEAEPATVRTLQLNSKRLQEQLSTHKLRLAPPTIEVVQEKSGL